MISDETLTLYFYGDGLSDAERQQIASALTADAALAGRYRQLTAELERLAVDVTPPAPPEAVVRWRYELDNAIAAETVRQPRPFVWFASAAAVLVIGIAIGMNLSVRQNDNATPVIAESPPPAPGLTAQPSALTRGVTAYMRESRLQLVGLQSSDDETRIELITHIIEQNRLFERAADANDAPELARVLRAFEQMLMELARQEAAPRDIDAATDQLSFEYAVMLTKLKRDASQSPTSL